MNTLSRILTVSIAATTLAVGACSRAKDVERSTTAEESKVSLQADSGFARPIDREPGAQTRTGGDAFQNAPASDRPTSEQPAPVIAAPVGEQQRGKLPSEMTGGDPPPRTLLPSDAGSGGKLPSESDGQATSTGGGTGGSNRAALALSALRSEPGMEAVTVEETADGCIKLGGHVRTAEKKEQARAMAAGITRAGCVINQIEVVK